MVCASAAMDDPQRDQQRAREPIVASSVEELLAACTVRVNVDGQHRGTGFFVADRTVATAANVVKADADPAGLSVTLPDGTEVPATPLRVSADRDVALLAVGELGAHPTVYADDTVQTRDPLYAFGFSQRAPEGAPTLCEAEGMTGGPAPCSRCAEDSSRPEWAEPPCSISGPGPYARSSSRTRDASRPLGGYATPVSFALALDRSAAGAAAHNPAWTELMTPAQRAPEPSRASLEVTLAECTLRIDVGSEPVATGFFVAPGVVATTLLQPDEPALAVWHGQPYPLRPLREDHDRRVALLQTDVSGHPCALLLGAVRPSDPLLVFSYTSRWPLGETTLLEAEGVTGGALPRLAVRGGPIVLGMGGAPVLNSRTGHVCGMVLSTNDAERARGGTLVRADDILALDPSVREANERFHAHSRGWLEQLAPDQRALTRPAPAPRRTTG